MLFYAIRGFWNLLLLQHMWQIYGYYILFNSMYTIILLLLFYYYTNNYTITILYHYYCYIYYYTSIIYTIILLYMCIYKIVYNSQKYTTYSNLFEYIFIILLNTAYPPPECNNPHIKSNKLLGPISSFKYLTHSLCFSSVVGRVMASKYICALIHGICKNAILQCKGVFVDGVTVKHLEKWKFSCIIQRGQSYHMNA